MTPFLLPAVTATSIPAAQRRFAQLFAERSFDSSKHQRPTTTSRCTFQCFRYKISGTHLPDGFVIGGYDQPQMPHRSKPVLEERFQFPLVFLTNDCDVTVVHSSGLSMNNRQSIPVQILPALPAAACSPFSAIHRSTAL